MYGRQAIWYMYIDVYRYTPIDVCIYVSHIAIAPCYNAHTIVPHSQTKLSVYVATTAASKRTVEKWKELSDDIFYWNLILGALHKYIYIRTIRPTISPQLFVFIIINSIKNFMLCVFPIIHFHNADFCLLFLFGAKKEVFPVCDFEYDSD